MSPLWSLTGQGAQTQETELNIEVHIYNYSTVSDQSTAVAEQETATIFERIGVTLAWVTCCVASREGVRVKKFGDAAPVFVIRILSNSMADKLGASADIIGSARLPVDDSFGEVADVYPDRARGLWHGKEFDIMLGRIIAHELGHLLLGKNEHSGVGIMKARWGSRDAEPANQGAKFYPSQAKRIRAQIIARMAIGSTRQSERSAALIRLTITGHHGNNLPQGQLHDRLLEENHLLLGLRERLQSQFASNDNTVPDLPPPGRALPA